ncbi:MAG: hypothetical protein HN576_16260 [Bacteriovoracaceae bacterium]|jgi:hypothetical protein|nr:hypothetical protein [Bacteriovoracaceae bacterium]
MKLIALLALLISFNSFANLHQAPPTLDLSRFTKGVFVDFISAKSLITYDVTKKLSAVETTIIFKQEEVGKPIFDLVVEPKNVVLNSMRTSISTQTVSMNGTSTVRFLDEVLGVGTHKMVITNLITKNLAWSTGSVKSAFWMSDLSDRRYLEQYLPTNLEYDQYKMDFEVKIIDAHYDHNLYTNGDIKELAKNHWSVSYPETFTASSLYFHLTKKGVFDEKRAVYTSIDGRKIPFIVYTSSRASRYLNSALEVVAELEKDYGPWPHSQVLIYGAGSGGMEYCGATITSSSALGHELTHSYFARGVMPAHGNSGWVDEAVASWRDGGYRGYNTYNLSRTKMAGHSVYQRTTDRAAYSKGMKFLGYLHKRFLAKESFKVFLKSFFERRKFKPFKTPEFQKAIEDFYNVSLSAEFDKYVYGKSGIDMRSSKNMVEENKYHPRLTEKELLNLL